ncbi:pilus assembly protein TadG-related protein [Janthinobacterium fluminis]|uniref:Pilus assembly protein TadG-related protein n=1 Tax=Janthinobacterium fluminis TaxID=2987524 RepID=A0ABT5JZ68_9BURK|nr:pilus assembly protein TadG-related protein [Janthinobacterium fluminis]MDC8758019.1 pilus assembly protein TadG-related protein [Janthinobacterium fluminis]
MLTFPTLPRQRGSVPVAVALLLPVLIGCAGLANDSGQVYLARRQMQTAADAGARSAALELRRQAADADVIAAARGDAALNGFPAGSVSVRLLSGPGPSPARSGYVEVLVAQAVPTPFMGLLGTPSVAVSARAVAGARPGGNCFLALNRNNVGNAMEVTGAGEVAANNCDVFVNGSVAGTLAATGAITVSGRRIGLQGPSASRAEGGNFKPAPQTGQPAEADPLARLATPAGGPLRNGANIRGNTTLAPGTYPGGIHISGSASVVFQPGIYVLQGGFSVNGAVNLDGAGVAFYTQGPVDIRGSGVVQLAAPATGPMAGILFYGDRALAKDDNNLVGSSAWTLAGTLYFPSSKLSIVGSGGLKGEPYLMLIADTMSFTGGMESNFKNPVYNPAFSGAAVAVSE